MDEQLKSMLEAKNRVQLPNVLLAAAECVPLAKTGGLADVVGTLPKALKKLGMDARVILPYHKVIKNRYRDRVIHMADFHTRLGWRSEYVGLERMEMDGTVFYLIDNEQYFGGKIYSGGSAEGEQYSFFTRAVLDCIPLLDFVPDVIHCNDWHTAMIPMLAHTQYPGLQQDKIKYLFTIHNIAFQGKYSYELLADLLHIDKRYYTSEYLELNGGANFMKAGCVFADRINTVSPSYASEIRTEYYGEGLEGILNARSGSLSGIINGIDRDVFNPETDTAIAVNFSEEDPTGKAACKTAIQRQMGLQQNPDVPLFAMVTRMTEQKGFDLMMCVVDELMQHENMQIVLLGSGDERFENFMRGAEARYQGRLSTYFGYNDELSHQVYAGADFYIMPSRFEPCGLSQMIAMRYGTVPIVRETGGLKDTVAPYNRFGAEGNGFSFVNYDAWELRDVIGYALHCYQDKEIMNGLIRNAMAADFSFDDSALKYAELYVTMLDPAPEKPAADR